MAGAMSEIIHCVDSEITAGTAVVKKKWQPEGLRNSITAAEGCNFADSVSC